MTDLSPFFLDILSRYSIPAVFIGAFFLGESVIITAAYLAAGLHWSVPSIFLAAFFGTVFSDTLWFLFGGIVQRYASRIQSFQTQRAKAAELLEKLAGTRPFLALLFIKFLYGSRIAMIIYVAHRKISLATFTIFNSIGALIWLAVIFPLGYLTGKGVARTLPILNILEIGIVIFIISAIIFRLFSIWFTKKITKSE